MRPTNFESARERSGRVNMCPRCGEREVEGVVAIKLSEKNAINTSVHQVASRQLSACEPCCVHIWAELGDLLGRAVHGSIAE